MYLLIASFFVCVHVSGQQTTTIDPSIFENIFGTPPTTGKLEDGSAIDIATLIKVFGSPREPTPRPDNKITLCDITVKPTESNSFIDKNGQPCKCVPYYLCNSDLVGVDINNASVTGWGELDIRFGEDECQESVEKCCTNPKSEDDNMVVQKPDPAKLKGCGYRNPKGLDFTIKGGNGDEAEFGEFPWVVALIDAHNDTYSGVGVLIHPQVVLTAAHNVYRYGPNAMRIRAGEWDTQTTKERLPYQERLVQEIVLNEDFQRKNVFNDIAILRAEKPFELTNHINVICLPEQGESFEQSKRCAVGGWGKDKFGLKGRYAVILKKIEQDMVPHGRCDQLLKKTRLGPHFKLHRSFVCAGGQEGKDTCQGDGGAPLVCPIGDNRYKLTGLVSWGIGCGLKDVPAVYAAVPNFREWIDGKMAAWGYETSGYNV